MCESAVTGGRDSARRLLKQEAGYNVNSTGDVFLTRLISIRKNRPGKPDNLKRAVGHAHVLIYVVAAANMQRE